MKTFPSPEALRRFPFGLADIAVILGTLVLLAAVARVGADALVRFVPPDIVPAIDLDPWDLPYYAGRSTLRMFIALSISTVFTLAYGYSAANSRRAATGLGTYIAEATSAGDWSRITLGIGMMSLFVVGLNRLLWRQLYQLAETKYHL